MPMIQRKATGSRWLGQELRRLRGGRKLEDVARLSQSGVFGATTRPLSVAALSEMEHGKYLPNLDALMTLCLTYRASPASFLRRILEERLVEGHDLPETLEELEEQAKAALRDSRWPRALALVLAGEQQAPDEASRLRWRLRHAHVLTNIGMLDQASLELQDALDSPWLPKDLRGRVHLDIANVASRMGHFTVAAFHVEAALAEPASEPATAFRVRALQTSIVLAIRRHERGCSSDRDLREAARRVDEGLALLAPGDEVARLCLETYRAQVQHALGQRMQAHELYRRLEPECERLGDTHVHACVLTSHAELLVDLKRPAAARQRLEHAARIAADGHAVDHAFEAHHLLAGLARTDAERELHRRACQRYLSMTTSPTPRMREFEAARARGDA